MDRKRFALTAAIGCGVLILLLIIVVPMLFFFPFASQGTVIGARSEVVTPPPGARATQEAIPTLPAQGSEDTNQIQDNSRLPQISSASLTDLYDQLNPGVVNIQVYVEQQGMTGQGAGSGFVLDEAGHIVTNHHVVAQAEQVTAIFYNELEAEAEIIGTDADSDLAVIKVDELPEGVHPLALGNSDQVEVGEWVVAIGNPFGQQSSISIGIVSAVGRTIPSGETPFSIPRAIQTDAAINPGNSGGPLLNLNGEIIGVNAQIAAGGPVRANAGVGFAIPVNVVRRVAPVLIESGTYQWPWLGVQGGSVNLAIARANNLDTQLGAYIATVVEDGPAAKAGLQGTSGTSAVNGLEVPVGGDVVVEADGQPVRDFSDLLAYIATKQPDDQIQLTVLREGQAQQLTVELAARPAETSDNSSILE